MLVLTRRANESIVIGADAEIEIVVLSTKRKQIKLGINASRSIPVNRKEIYDRIQSKKVKE